MKNEELLKTKSKTYKYQVFVIDMFHYDETWNDKEYETADEAIERAKYIVLRSFNERGKAGYDEWLRFGESASIIALNGAEAVNFSAQDFVKEICNVKK